MITFLVFVFVAIALYAFLEDLFLIGLFIYNYSLASKIVLLLLAVCILFFFVIWAFNSIRNLKVALEVFNIS